LYEPNFTTSKNLISKIRQNKIYQKIPELVSKGLHKKGKTIDEIQRNQKLPKIIPGDGEQEKLRNLSIWHNKIEIDKFVQQKLKISDKEKANLTYPNGRDRFYDEVVKAIRILRKNNEIIDWRKIDEVRTGIWRVKDFEDISTKKVQIFLTSIEQEQKDVFKNKFIQGIKNSNINSEKNSTDLQSMHVWSFFPSEKNLKLWKNIEKNDWILFYINGRYSIAGKILKKEKSKKITEKIFGKKVNNKNLLIFCNNIFEIKKGFQKTNSDMGFKTTIPEIHKIKLIQSKAKSVQNIIEKFGNIESYLEIKISKFKRSDITKIIPSSMKKEPRKIETKVLRRVRDTVKSKKLKEIYNNQCQICNYSFPKYVGVGYSEVHHVWPIGDNGDDDYDNMLVLCPNHHAEFDYRVIRFNSENSKTIEDLEGNILGLISFKNRHKLDKKNVEYHNTEVRRTFFES